VHVSQSFPESSAFSMHQLSRHTSGSDATYTLTPVYLCAALGSNRIESSNMFIPDAGSRAIRHSVDADDGVCCFRR